MSKQKIFDRLREEIKNGDEETIHFIMTQARNISSYIIKENTEKNGPGSFGMVEVL